MDGILNSQLARHAGKLIRSTSCVNIKNRSLTVNGFVDSVEGIVGVKLKRKYNLSAPKGVNGLNSDNTLIQARLGREPDTRLHDAICRITSQ